MTINQGDFYTRLIRRQETIEDVIEFVKETSDYFLYVEPTPPIEYKQAVMNRIKAFGLLNYYNVSVNLSTKILDGGSLLPKVHINIYKLFLN